jgi:hypothetical protein
MGQEKARFLPHLGQQRIQISGVGAPSRV